jgi:hypothetical protein
VCNAISRGVTRGVFKDHPTKLELLTMARRKSLLARERGILIDKALLGTQSGKYKSAYEAETASKLPKSSVTRRVNGSQARQKQQKPTVLPVPRPTLFSDHEGPPTSVANC